MLQILNFLVFKDFFKCKRFFKIKYCLYLNLKQNSYIIYKIYSDIKANFKSIKLLIGFKYSNTVSLVILFSKSFEIFKFVKKIDREFKSKKKSIFALR